MQQRDPGFVGFSFSQSEQSADFKAVGVPSVSSLKQNRLNDSRLQQMVRLDSVIVTETGSGYVVEEVPDAEDEFAEAGQPGALPDT